MTADGLEAVAQRAPETSPVPDRYIARYDDPDDPEELTIFDEAVADGLAGMETWLSAEWWIELEEAR